MIVLLDLNVVLDVLLVREPWFHDSGGVWDANHDNRIRAYVASFSLPTIYYLVRRHAGVERAYAGLRICFETLDILPVHRGTLELARTFPGHDFEDNLQLACATESALDAIVTRNSGDFAGASMAVLTPTALLSILARPAVASPL